MGKIWDWIKQHAIELVAGSVGVIVAAYLIWQGQQSAAGAQQGGALSFPPSNTGGGGSGGSSGGSTPTTPAPITLPFNPDFSVLANITDTTLRGLYENEYNLEVQINEATATGNTALVTSLTSSLNSIQAQIASYTPATPAPTAPVVPTLTQAAVNAWQNTYLALAPANQTFQTWLAAAPTTLTQNVDTATLQQIYTYLNSEAGKVAVQAAGGATNWFNLYLANPTTTPITASPTPTTGGGAVTALTASAKTPIITPTLSTNLVKGR